MPYRQKNRYYDPKPDSSDDDDDEEEKKEDDDDDDEEEEEERPKQVVQVIQVIQVVANDDDDDDDDGEQNDEPDAGNDRDAEEYERSLRDNFAALNFRRSGGSENNYQSGSGGYSRDDDYGNNSQDYARRETYRYEDGNISTGTEIRTWSQHMVPVRMKNFSDHYVQYRYSDGDTGQFVSQGVLEPNHVNTAMKVALNTRYHFEFRVGQKVIKKIKMFTREEEWDVDRFFEHL